MTSTIIFCTVIVLFTCILFYNDGVEGRKLWRKDDDIDKKLKLLNKPYLKTIKTQFGDIYDCVDFYKQPAFDHPLLKNHTFHPRMRPNFSPAKATPKSDVSNNFQIESQRFRLNCPKGTVPIKRVAKDDLIRIESLMENSTLRSFTSNGVQAGQGTTHFAIGQSVTTPKPEKFRGVQGTVSIYKPPIESSQYTSGEVIIQNNGDTLKAGWMVNPSVYSGSTETRSFAYFNVGKKPCFNVLCPGFVVVNQNVPVDQVYPKISTRGGPIYTDKYFIYQDEIHDDWWLDFGDETIGFWPYKILSSLQDSGTYVACGGETYSPNGQSPPMGSGHKPIGDSRQDGYCSDFSIVDVAHKVTQLENIQTFTDDTKSYEVDNEGVTSELGQLFLFGGPY